MKTPIRFFSASCRALMILAFACCCIHQMHAQTYFLTESFENGGSVPNGWATEVVSGGNTISFPTLTSYPYGYPPYDGTYLVMFDSYNVNGGLNRLKMTSPVSVLGCTSVSVDFAWLESSGYSSANDRVDVQYSTDGASWTTAGTFARYNPVDGWKVKTQVLPAGALGTTSLYVAFLFTSAYGYDCYLDLVHITGVPASSVQPQHYNYNTTGSANSFPFNIVEGKEVQLLYLPGDFNQPTPASAGYISSIAFRIHDTYPLGPWTYTDFTIKMGQSSITSFATGGFYSPLTTVLYRTSMTLTGAAGGWMTIPLDYPFAYDPGQSLIVEIGQCGAAGATGYSACFTGLTGIRRNWSTGGCPFTFYSGNNSVVHMGLNIEPDWALFDNGPIRNSIGTGALGSDESIYYQEGLETWGTGCQHDLGFYLTDDFTVPFTKIWAVTSIDFFGYQTNSTTTSTFSGIYIRVWNGKPGDPGSAVIWGDMTTNRLDHSGFVNVYRVLTTGEGTARPVMKISANTAGLVLYQGYYWIEWACTGSPVLTGPWAPPVVTSEMVTGNGMQTTDAGGSYYDVTYNGYAQGFPFILNGSEIIYPYMILQNVTIPAGQTSCYNAIQTISVAGNGTTFVVQNGGSATMIAGKNILFNSGTKVQSGGYLSGYIAPGGPYCSMPLAPVVNPPSGSAMVINETEVSTARGPSSFRIYPNPTSGTFLLELPDEIRTGDVTVDIMGLQGEKVLSAVLQGGRLHEISISDCKAGIYFIRVVSGDRSEIAKIIKR